MIYNSNYGKAAGGSRKGYAPAVLLMVDECEACGNLRGDQQAWKYINKRVV